MVEMPSISRGEGATLLDAVLMTIFKFQCWYEGLDPAVQQNTPLDAGAIIFLHSKRDVDAVCIALNKSSVAAACCTCYKKCSLGLGCRHPEQIRAVRYHSGVPDAEKTTAYTQRWRCGVNADAGSAFIMVTTAALEVGINPDHVIFTASPCGPPPSIHGIAQGIIGKLLRIQLQPYIFNGVIFMSLYNIYLI